MHWVHVRIACLQAFALLRYKRPALLSASGGSGPRCAFGDVGVSGEDRARREAETMEAAPQSSGGLNSGSETVGEEGTGIYPSQTAAAERGVEFASDRVLRPTETADAADTEHNRRRTGRFDYEWENRQWWREGSTWDTWQPWAESEDRQWRSSRAWQQAEPEDPWWRTTTRAEARAELEDPWLASAQRLQAPGPEPQGWRSWQAPPAPTRIQDALRAVPSMTVRPVAREEYDPWDPRHG